MRTLIENGWNAFLSNKRREGKEVEDNTRKVCWRSGSMELMIPDNKTN
jgi:hypothetical protein